MQELQWGGRFEALPDAGLLTFGSSLEEDLLLAPFDVLCSAAHVAALLGGSIISFEDASALNAALVQIASEMEDGSFASYARASAAEDIHGAIDARVRALAGRAGGSLHAGRSRNDQVATTLILYARDRAVCGRRATLEIARSLVRRAHDELRAGTLVAATTHWQPAQPILLAFWLAAAAEMFVRGASRFKLIEMDARKECPLGSGAVSGSTLRLDRDASATALGFDAPSRNALDAIGTRDVALDLAHGYVRAVLDASRISEELVLWCTPAFGYVRLGDAASTGSSLMPQKRNPDPFELVRANAARLNGSYAGALGTLCGLGLSYHRDLQQTKALAIEIVERGLQTLNAFLSAFSAVEFLRSPMTRSASAGYAVATDIADALIASGIAARDAHAMVGAAVTRCEREGRAFEARDLEALASEAGLPALDAPLEAVGSVRAKQTAGSTSPTETALQLASIEAEIYSLSEPA